MSNSKFAIAIPTMPPVRPVKYNLPRRIEENAFQDLNLTTFEEFCGRLKIKTLDGYKPFNLLCWQQQFAHLILTELADRQATVSVMKSRQVGNTLLTLAIALWLSLTISHHTSLILHLTFADAWNLCRRLRKLVQQLPIKMVTDSLSLLEFPNGSTIYFRSADPETCGRGLENVDFLIVEEQAHQSQLSKTLEITDPMQTHSRCSKLILIGTPNGKRSHYYERLKNIVSEQTINATVEGIRSGTLNPYQQFSQGDNHLILLNWRSIKRFREQANPTFLDRIRQKGKTTEIGILTEYELEFSESETGIFAYSLVQTAIAGEFTETYDPSCDYYLGLDTATTGSDYLVALVGRWDGRKMQIVAMYRSRRKGTDTHLAAISELISHYRIYKIGIEKNGPGTIYAEQLSKKHKNTSIDEISTTSQSKPGLINRVVLGLEREQIQFPDCVIGEELLSYRQYDDGSMGATSGSHDDTTMSLAMLVATSPIANSYRWDQVTQDQNQMSEGAQEILEMYNA